MGVLKKAIENYLKERSKSQLIPNYCLTISLSREGVGISKQGTSIEELDWNWKFLVDSVLVMIFYMDKSSKFHRCSKGRGSSWREGGGYHPELSKLVVTAAAKEIYMADKCGFLVARSPRSILASC